ncbi:hypothetical protein, partial [Neglectibacter timonensis]
NLQRKTNASVKAGRKSTAVRPSVTAARMLSQISFLWL